VGKQRRRLVTQSRVPKRDVYGVGYARPENLQERKALVSLVQFAWLDEGRSEKGGREGKGRKNQIKNAQVAARRAHSRNCVYKGRGTGKGEPRSCFVRFTKSVGDAGLRAAQIVGGEGPSHRRGCKTRSWETLRWQRVCFGLNASSKIPIQNKSTPAGS